MNPSDPFETFDDFDALGEADSFGETREARPEACLVCEAMCPDAVDNTLTEAERSAFEQHIAVCPHCAQELADAQRGAAWLGLLKSQTPEPPATLLARILAETSEAVSGHETSANATERDALAVGLPAGSGPEAAGLETEAVGSQQAVPSTTQPFMQPAALAASRSLHPAEFPGFQTPARKAQAVSPAPVVAEGRGKVLPFRGLAQRFASLQNKGSGLHPRLAMTAAMAFFSIALTLNLTGVRLRDLRVEDLRPAAIERSAAAMQASAVRSFQNLRVVYQVESRVSELRQDPLWDDQAGAKPRPPAKRPVQDETRTEPNQN